jgi:hypothetical protein
LWSCSGIRGGALLTLIFTVVLATGAHWISIRR